MKMRNIISMVTVFATLAFASCKKEENVKPVEGDALFTYVADGLSVTFTNTSTVSGDYLWDFGDSNTATEENPVHVYAKKGEYTVTLTVTDKNGDKHDVSTKFKVDKTSPVKLDDNSFADWAGIKEGFTIGTADQAGVIKSFKYDFDKDMIYFYIKLETDAVKDAQILDMMFDTTIDGTGYTYDIWPSFGGAELLIENSFSNTKDNEDLYFVDFANYDPKGSDWDTKWIYDEGNTADAQTDGTYKVTGNVVELEFGVSRKNIPALKGKEKVKIVAWTSNPDWDENGWMPNKNPSDNSIPEADGIIIDMQ